jgi:hypothetical protein
VLNAIVYNQQYANYVMVLYSPVGYKHPCIVCNENQPNALFILNLFHQSTSTCFGRIYCPSTGGIHCMCVQQLVHVVHVGDWQLVGQDGTSFVVLMGY